MHGRPSWLPLSFPVFADPRGRLAVSELQKPVPFAVAGVRLLHGVAAGTRREGCAHRRLQCVLFALSGGFSLTVDDGRHRDVLRLSDPAAGLYVGPMVWTELGDFAPGTVAVCLASLPHDESDYIRDSAAFRRAVEDAR